MDRLDDIEADDQAIESPTENVSRSVGFILEIDVQGRAETGAGPRLESKPLRTVNDCVDLFSRLLDRDVDWSRWAPDTVDPAPWERLRDRRKILSSCVENLVFDFIISDLEEKIRSKFPRILTELIILLGKVRTNGFHGHWICAKIYEEFETIALPIEGAYFVKYPFYVMPSDTVNGLKWVARRRDNNSWWEYHDTEEEAKLAISGKLSVGETSKERARKRTEHAQRRAVRFVFVILMILFSGALILLA